MGADPRRVRTRADLARELDLLRASAARGTGRRRVSLSDLAKRSEVPRSTLHTYLTGRSLPPADVLDQVVVALGGGDQAAWGDAWDRVAEHEHEVRRAAPEAPRLLPPDVPMFSGRDDQLRALDDLIDARTSGAVVVSVIAGMAGVGKTALAVRWAHRVAHRFPDGQLHVDLRGYDPVAAPMTSADAAGALLRALGITDIPPSSDERVNRLRGVLAGRRVLVLLDNASSADQVRPLLPATSTCFTVMTSRDSLVGLAVLDGAHRLDLDVLSEAEALGLLRLLLGERVDHEHDAAVELVRGCARLPLALRVVAEVARSEPLRRVVAELTEERLDLLDSSGDPRSMVRAVFSWSHRRLPPDAAELFRLLGLHPGRDFDVPAAAALAGADPARAAEGIAVLVGANLVQDDGAGRFGMHDLLQEYSRELASAMPSAARGAAATRLLDHYATAVAAASALVYPAHHSGEVAAALPWLPDPDVARTWLDAEADNIVAVVGFAASAGFRAHPGKLADAAARHLDTTARWSQALRMHRAALEVAADGAAQATALRNMGIAAEALGEHRQALEWLRGCMDHRRALGDRQGVSATLNSIGITLDSMSRFDEAIAAYEESVAIERDLGNEHRAAIGLLNLGVVLEQRGEVERALANHREALDAFRAAGDPLGEAHALTNVGNLLNLDGGHAQARELLVSALAVYRDLGSRIGEAYALNGLGVALSGLGDQAAALARYSAALEITGEVGDSGLRSEVLNRIGVLRCDLAEYPAARDAHHEALLVAREHGDRLEEAKALDGLGRIALATGSLAAARRHWQRALDRYEALRVPDAERLRAAMTTL